MSKKKPTKPAPKAPTTKADGKRTSRPGALVHFRALWAPGYSVSRKALIESMVKTFGPKAKWATMNYVASAKQGKLKDCPKLTEDEDGILRAPGKAKAPGKRSKARKAASMAAGE